MATARRWRWRQVLTLLVVRASYMWRGRKRVSASEQLEAAHGWVVADDKKSAAIWLFPTSAAQQCSVGIIYNEIIYIVFRWFVGCSLLI